MNIEIKSICEFEETITSRETIRTLVDEGELALWIGSCFDRLDCYDDIREAIYAFIEENVEDNCENRGHNDIDWDSFEHKITNIDELVEHFSYLLKEQYGN